MRLLTKQNVIVDCPEDVASRSKILQRCRENGETSPVPVRFEEDAVRSWVRGPEKRIMSDKEIIASFEVAHFLEAATAEWVHLLARQIFAYNSDPSPDNWPETWALLAALPRDLQESFFEQAKFSVDHMVAHTHADCRPALLQKAVRTLDGLRTVHMRAGSQAYNLLMNTPGILRTIEVLDLSLTYSQSDVLMPTNSMQAFSQMTALRSLDLRLAGVTAPGFAALAPHLSGLSQLTHLDLSGNVLHVRPHKSQHPPKSCLARAMSRLPASLCSLRLANTELTGPEAAAALASRTALTRLSLRDNTFGVEGISGLSLLLAKFKTLAGLDLSFARITARAATPLARLLIQLPSLTSLQLGSNGLGAGVKDLAAALVTLTNLAKLNLRSNGIDHNVMHALAEDLPAMTRLSSLNLAGNPLGGSGVDAVVDAAHLLPRLAIINISHVYAPEATLQNACLRLARMPQLQRLVAYSNDLDLDFADKLREAASAERDDDAPPLVVRTPYRAWYDCPYHPDDAQRIADFGNCRAAGWDAFHDSDEDDDGANSSNTDMDDEQQMRSDDEVDEEEFYDDEYFSDGEYDYAAGPGYMLFQMLQHGHWEP